MGYLDNIKQHCLWCMNGQKKEVALCTSEGCPLYLFRYGKRCVANTTPLKAIHERCYNCIGFSKKLVKECPFDGQSDEKCHLYDYRNGRNPNLKGKRKANNKSSLNKNIQQQLPDSKLNNASDS